MIKVLAILFSYGLISSVAAQSFSDNFKLAYPNLVHQGKSFEVSIITSNEFNNADKLDLYVIPKRGIKPDEFLLRFEKEVTEIEFSGASSEGYLYDAVMCSIDLTEAVLEESGSFFQILMRFQSELIDYSEIEFYGEFRENNRLVDYLYSSDIKLLSDYPNHHRIKLNFYTSSINEKALLLESGSEFTVQTDIDIQNDLLFEYWINLNQKGYPFLEIKNSNTDLVEYRLTLNDFQIATAESDFNSELFVTPHFVPSNVWLHFSALFLFNNKQVEFYCDGMELASFRMSPSLTSNELIFSFINGNVGEFQIDQLRVIDLNESITSTFNSKTFSSFVSEKSKTKFQLSFNETTLSDLGQIEFISINNGTITPSDAPVFSRAPELNIKILSNFYELTWGGGDYANAAKYIVERAEGESGFQEVYGIDSDDSGKKDLTFLSERKDDSEVIYFRVKQINKDGSVLYSSQVKIGQAEIQEFILGQNFPNPFNPSTQISVEVVESSEFQIVVYTLEGKEVEVLFEGYLAQGEYQFKFDGSELPSGIYLYKVSSPNFNQTKKMILAK
ncbi:MAG: T9SS type A sorting domain-containing protein [Ignavibacterium sp.]|nr:MAG: T9SS type A sorting domain-containing protein [Ignavibacterium sp.]